MSVAPLTKTAILKMYDGHCAYCGGKLCRGTVTIDHVFPKSHGGTRQLSNIKPSCAFCNLIKGSRSINSFRQRLKQEIDNKTKLEKEIRKRYKVADGKIEFYFETIERNRKSYTQRMNEAFKQIEAERNRKEGFEEK